MEYSSKSIKLDVSCSATLEEMWERWTTHEGLLTFFSPDNWIEFKVGGAFEMYFLLDGERGMQGSEGCKILSYLPHKMLSFSWNAPPSNSTVRNHIHKTWVVVVFSEYEGGVNVQLNHLGFLKGNDWDEALNYFEQAWKKVMDRLKANYK